MIIIPSIDIKDGKCVRLLQGNFEQVTEYSLSPAARARQFYVEGASYLHIVDLDSAKNGYRKDNIVLQETIKSFSGRVQVGGGVRSKQDIERLLEMGAACVVLGTISITNPEIVSVWIQEFGAEKIVLAFDFRVIDGTPYVATSGWQTMTELTVWEVLAKFKDAKYILCTDIGKDGMQQGPNFNFYQECKQRFPGLLVQASGGVGSLEDITKLKEMDIYGAIIGKAIYENKLTVKEALLC